MLEEIPLVGGCLSPQSIRGHPALLHKFIVASVTTSLIF